MKYDSLRTHYNFVPGTHYCHQKQYDQRQDDIIEMKSNDMDASKVTHNEIVIDMSTEQSETQKGAIAMMENECKKTYRVIFNISVAMFQERMQYKQDYTLVSNVQLFDIDNFIEFIDLIKHKLPTNKLVNKKKN